MVKTGLDKLVASDFAAVKGARVGILAHAASVDSNLQHVVDLLHASTACEVVRVFAPEHGFRGALQDMASVGKEVDRYTKLPIESLYGTTEASLTPSEDALRDLDVVVIDIQDVGSRYYTYTQTMALVMKVAGKVGVKVLVLDRPNPLGGVEIEGALLKKSCRSFCGFAPVANRHGLTVGEFAKLYQAGFGEGDDHYPAISCELEVVEMTGWKRKMYFDDTGLPWVMPSPNMPTLETAVVYPGGCLFEATTVSEGRGTTRPFELVGAPYIDGFEWVEETKRQGFELEGVVFRPTAFHPGFQKHERTDCHGFQIHVTDRAKLQPFRLGLALLGALRRLYPNDFAWRGEAFEFVDKVPAIDLLYGSPTFRECLSAGSSAGEIQSELEEFEGWYREARKEFLLY